MGLVLIDVPKRVAGMVVSFEGVNHDDRVVVAGGKITEEGRMRRY